MKRIVIAGMLCLIFATLVEAAPRNGRRARRRAARQSTPLRVNTYQRAVVPNVAEGDRTTAYRPVLDPLPEVDSSTVASDSLPTVEDSSSDDSASTQATEVADVNPALAELNAMRRRRGLRTLIEDRGLSVIARQKASLQARRGWMGHPGGTMGGARFEGVGVGARFISCYQYASNVTHAGAASVTGSNGRRYHCLLLR